MKLYEMFPTLADFPADFFEIDFPLPLDNTEGTFQATFYNRFYYRETFTGDREEFWRHFNLILGDNYQMWKILLTKYNEILNGFAVPNDRRVVRNFPAPNGVPNTAHVLDMMEELREGTGDENIDRQIRVNEFRSYWQEFFDKFEPLFIGVWQI